ncbi:MAG: hypothetical protein JW751_22450 [Polyangiaceae bacterium]|nr:hypothetical protein [Polyangiaceae bacterium]
MHKTLIAAPVLTLMLAAGTAAAEDFGDRRTVVFSADRLFGLYLTHRQIDGDDNLAYEDGDDVTEVGFLMQEPGLTPFTVPRLSVDYFLTDHLSIGGSIGFAHSDTEPDDADDATYNSFFFGPRIGGAWMFADWAGIWPRWGVSYYSIDDQGTDSTQFALNAEALFVLAPARGFAFTIGPVADIGLFGEYDPPVRGEADLHLYDVGLAVGMMGYFGF